MAGTDISTSLLAPASEFLKKGLSGKHMLSYFFVIAGIMMTETVIETVIETETETIMTVLYMLLQQRRQYFQILHCQKWTWHWILSLVRIEMPQGSCILVNKMGSQAADM